MLDISFVSNAPLGVALGLGISNGGRLLENRTSEPHSGRLGTFLALNLHRGKAFDVGWTDGEKGVPICLVGLGDPATRTLTDIEKAAAAIVRGTRPMMAVGMVIDLNGALEVDSVDIAIAVALGAQMGAYRFDAYRARTLAEQTEGLGLITKLLIVCDRPEQAESAWQRQQGLVAGMRLTRDLVSEPPNVLTPTEFARRIEALSSDGLVVEVLDESQMAALGMGALLSVGQGSVEKSVLAVIKWAGGKSDQQPLVLIGKGVTFDTGGISIKPQDGMQEMKADMGGAAAIVGAMRSIAARKSKANVIAVVGLVENMPSGSAYRPGDIVETMSGRTVEITNTDAEGRLVLCDAIHFAITSYAPAALVDMATLTGVAMMALGYEHAALFSNSDELAAAITQAGTTSQETVWRMPMGKAYDAAMDSTFADMKNAAGRLGGAITAAQFLGRFVPTELPWAHIDMGGKVQVPSGDFKNNDPRMPSWATGWGVRLLDRLVADRFEEQTLGTGN